MKIQLFLVLLLCAVSMPMVAQEDAAAEEDEPICLEFMDSSSDVRTGYYMGEAVGYISSGQLMAAIGSYTCVIDEIDDTYIDAYIGRANAYTSRRNYEAAIEDYTRILELDSDSLAAHNNRGIVYAAMQEYELALEDFEAVLTIDDTYVLGYSNRGVIKAVLGDFEASIDDFETAISISGIDEIYAAMLDPENTEELEEYDWRAAHPYAMLGVVYSAYALDNYNAYLRLAGSRSDRRIQGAAGALESRFTFELRLDDGTWLFAASFSE